MSNTILSAMLGLHYKCQCSCPHCGISSYKKTHPENKILNPQEIFKIIDFLKELQINEVYFFGGEPLLDKNIYKYIDYAKKQGLFVKLDTNGLLLTKKNVLKLKNSGIAEIGISLDSPIEEKHDKLRGHKGIFRKAVTGILLCKSLGVPCYISHCVSSESIKNKESEALIKTAGYLAVKIRLLLPALCGKLQKKPETLLNNSEMNIFRNYLKKDAVFWENSTNDSSDSKLQCAAKNNQSFYISPYGDIQPCCYVPISFGNIRITPLKEILAYMQKQQIYKSYTEGCLASCREVKALVNNYTAPLPVIFKK